MVIELRDSFQDLLSGLDNYISAETKAANPTSSAQMFMLAVLLFLGQKQNR